MDDGNNRYPPQQLVKKEIKAWHYLASLKEVSALSSSKDEHTLTEEKFGELLVSHTDGGSNNLAAANDRAAQERRYPKRMRKSSAHFLMNALRFSNDKDGATVHKAIGRDDQKKAGGNKY